MDNSIHTRTGQSQQTLANPGTGLAPLQNIASIRIGVSGAWYVVALGVYPPQPVCHGQSQLAPAVRLLVHDRAAGCAHPQSAGR